MKKDKILKIFLIMLLIVSTAAGVIFAETINGNTYKNNGGTYHNAFQNKGKKLFDIKWSEIKNNYYTAGSSNDYQQYIVGSKDGYCLNEDTGDGKNGNFYPAAIIDINGGNVTVYSKEYPDGKSKFVGDTASEFAEVVYFKYNYPKRKDINSDSQNAYFGQYWVNHWGWHTLYDALINEINDENVGPVNVSKISSLEDDVVAPSYNLNNLSIKKNGDLTAQNGSFTVKNQTYKTKIGKYTINYHESLDLKIVATDVNGKEYSGIYFDGYLYFKSNINAELKSIKVSQSYTGYKARLILLGTGQEQARMIAYAKKTTISKSAIASDLPTFNVNVSLQKYITKVTTNNNIIKYNNLTTRSNKGTQGEGSPITGDDYKKQISTNNKSSNDSYKNTKPVSIEVGDKVTYRVYVYNNGKNTAKRIEVEDTLPSNILLNDTVLSKGTCKSITRSDGKVTASVENLGSGKSAYFEVTVHFTEYSSDKIWNTAKISSTDPTNSTSYRTQDGDSIIMKLEYEVSLEKYISSVHSNNTTTNNEIINYGTYDIIKTYLKTKNIPENNYKTEIEKLINNSDFNNDGKVDDKDLELLNSYLEDEIIGNITNIYNPTLINTLKNYKLADINKDDKIDSEDIEILNLIREDKYNNQILLNIQEYIKYDLNKDGIIDDNDVDIYKLIKLDVNEDKEINIYDLYTLMLMSLDLDNDNKISNTDLYKLKSYNLRNSGASRTQIEEYIRYDLNKDEIIDDNDRKLLNRIYNNWETTEVKQDGTEEIKRYSAYKGSAENILSINEGINNYNELLIRIQETINQYDTNGDGRVSVFDNGGESLLEIIELLDVNSNGMIELEMPLTYSSNMLEIINDSDYNIVNVLSYLEEESYIINKINENSGNYKLLDINEDGMINIEDLELYDEEFNINQEIFEMYNNEIDDFTEFVASYFIENGEIDIQNSVKNYINSDLDYNGTVNKNDYDIFINYAKLEIRNDDNNYLNTISLEGIDNSEFINRINVIKNYSIDINGDEVINEYDESLLRHYLEYNIQLPISEQITSTFIETVISSDINGDNNFTEEDLVLLESYNVAKLDLNGDETINEEDVKLLIEILRVDNIDNVVESIKKSNTTNYNTRSGKAEYLTYSNGKYVDNTKNDKSWTQHNTYKYDNIITVESGDYVTYTIKVTNDSNSNSIYITKILDALPAEGISAYKIGGYSENEKDYSKVPENGHIEINRTSSIKLDPGESTTVLVTVKVSASNMSVEIFKNTAKITEIKNTNGIIMDSDIYDKTPYNNMDSDYFQLNPGGDRGTETIISGTVWNDRALDKIQDNYNGAFDENSENKLSGIKVHLYRDGAANNPIATTITNDSGNYSFADGSIDSNVITNSWERYIKGPRVENTNRWSGTYYSYNIVFEYDGITYTSTILKDEQNCLGIYNNDYNDSNAKEDLETRTNFNNKFSPVNIDSGISYITNNQSEFIPQSIYQYNSNMAMQSSTDLIELSIDTNLEQLKHVNLGLRGRDIFDLELTSDVDSIKITVNNVPGVYKYSNKVNLRKEDLKVDTTTDEDMANRVSEADHDLLYVDEQTQIIRDTDINIEKAGQKGIDDNKQQRVNKYTNGEIELYAGHKVTEQSGINEIRVTYKITVHNTSRTKGTASKIINYFDDNYNFVKAYSGSNEMTIGDGAEYKETGAGYESVEITTPGTMLNQSETMDIYVEYTLNDPLSTLKEIDMLPTYNMAEITEYKTGCANGQTEYARGLIDKDSAPGSVNKEQVRTTDTVNQNTATTDGNPTTVNYYFNKKAEVNKDKIEYLQKLKYEDDTYATPTLYFVKDGENERTLSGKVFRDETQTSETKIKTGNGVYDEGEEGEVGVYGATVTLVEMVRVKEANGNEYETPLERFVTTTNKEGNFEFSGYLPGKYFVRYYYGNRTQTVVLNEGGEGINKYSFNGEDYQSTNNEYDVDGVETNKLIYYREDFDDNQKNFWHIYNESEGISTAQDNSGRRVWVSNNVINEEHGNNIMELLNEARSGELTAEYLNNKENPYGGGYLDPESLIYKTYMYSTTEDMMLSVEKPIINTETKELVEAESFDSYNIVNMNFGIAEVPVTTIDLQKHVSAFNIMDSTGQNKIAGITRKTRDDSTTYWEPDGNVIAPEGSTTIDVSIEDEKLQGARLQITYDVSVDMSTQKNFDNTESGAPTITCLVDFINNNLSYNETLGNNSDLWEVATYEGADPINKGAIDPNGTVYSIVLKAKDSNPIRQATATSGKKTAQITLEKVLSSTESTIDEIVASTIDTSEYFNIVEIMGFDYTNTKIDTNGDNNPDTEMKDRIRTLDRYIIIPGLHHDSARSETIVIHAPTGDNSISIVYYVIAIIGLTILAVGVFGIKKFVVKK